MTDPVGSISDAVRAMADLVKDMIDGVAALRERQRVTKEAKWASVLDAVATVKNLRQVS